MTPQELEQYVLVAADASHPQRQQQATVLLNDWTLQTSPLGIAECLLPVLQSTQQAVALFYSLTSVSRIVGDIPSLVRTNLRHAILQCLVLQGAGGIWQTTYLRVKAGVIVAALLRAEGPTPLTWQALEELQSSTFLQAAPDMYLRILYALMEEFGHCETDSNSQMKQWMRGPLPSSDTSHRDVGFASPICIAGRLLQTTTSLLTTALKSPSTGNGSSVTSCQTLACLALSVLTEFSSWLDISVLFHAEYQMLPLTLDSLQQGSKTDSPWADAAVEAIKCFQELVARGMDDEKKLSMLEQTRVLEHIYACVDLTDVDKSSIDVVMEVALFVNRIGHEILPILKDGTHKNGTTTTAVGGPHNNANTIKSDHSVISSQLLELLFRCFAYDDIDVSGAVIPFAGSLIASFDEQTNGSQLDPVLTQLMGILYRQVKYPNNFQFDYEDGDEAEEEMYRTELRKLNQKLIRISPAACLQFMGQALSQLPLPLSTVSTPEVEAAIRLVYHYCEGIRPPPGMKVVMKNENFRSILVALHESDISMHAHPEVISLYYETAVRYHPLLKDRPDLLQRVLEALSGPRGLQHGNIRVRSRSCYLLLKLVKSVGTSSTKKSQENVLRPYVETAISGILGLVELNSSQLCPDDHANLFETIGVLLGKTGLPTRDQQNYLTRIFTPHVEFIERSLKSRQSMEHGTSVDEKTLSGTLANAVGAMTCLSKGFKNPTEDIQVVFVEALRVTLSVLESFPAVGVVRSKSFVFVQRMILCLNTKVLPVIPHFLGVFIKHATSEDILDVAQLFNQLCTKFQEAAVLAIDSSLLPFLQKCHELSAAAHTSTGTDDIAPHQNTEQLSIQKLNFVVLQHVVTRGATTVLLTVSNVGSLEQILQSMATGAIHVGDASMKKTCLVFFKELVDQWLVVGDGREAPGKTPPPPSNVAQGYLKFVLESLLPGVFQSMLAPAFNVADASCWRCVLEVSAILHYLQQRIPEVYNNDILGNLVIGRFKAPRPVSDGLRSPAHRGDVESGLKALIQELRQ